jgi:hypothetical protein
LKRLAFVFPMAYEYAFRLGVSLEMGISFKWIESLGIHGEDSILRSSPI